MEGHRYTKDPKEVVDTLSHFVVHNLPEESHGENDETSAQDHNHTRDTGRIGKEKMYVSLVDPSKAMTEYVDDASNQDAPATEYVESMSILDQENAQGSFV